MKRISLKFLASILLGLILIIGLASCNVFNPQKESSSSTPPSIESDSAEVTPPISDSEIEEEPIPEHSRVIFILDASASMRTKNEEGITRFERAVEEAILLGDQHLAEEKLLSVILADNHPTVLLRENDTSAHTAFLETMLTLDDTQCSYASADMKGALALAKDLAGDNKNVEIVLFTGTNYQNTEGITVVDVSDENEWNAAVLDAKTSLTDGYYTLEVDVGCYGRDTEISLSIEISEEYGSITHLNTSVLCLDNQEMKVVFTNQDLYNQETFNQENTVYYLLDSNEKFYSYQSIVINVEENDSLSEDNTLILYDGIKPTLKTQYANDSSSIFTISMLLQCRSTFDYLDMQIREVKKDSNPEMEGYDFYLFENKSLDSLPQDGVVFLINPQTAANGFTLGDCVTGNFQLTFDSKHAITKNLADVTLSSYTKITDYDSSFTPIMWVNEDPVCLIKNTEKEKVLILSFDLSHSNFAITVSFPTFIYNIISYYFPQTADKTLVEAGETVTLNSRGESLNICGYNFETTLTQFPNEIQFNSSGSYVLKQTLIDGEELWEHVFVKIPQKESAIFRTEILPNPDYATVEVAISQNIEQCKIIKVQPLNRIDLGKNAPLQIFVNSTYEGEATLRLYRNDILENSTTVNLVNGSQILEINTSFDCDGAHIFTFEIVKNDGSLLTKQENFSSVLTIEKKENILILESIVGESQKLCNLFEEEYSLACLNISEAPTDLSQLSNYDQIILVNVANADMPVGFDETLRVFVEEMGGSLFTVGGNDENGEVNAYNRNDMYGTLYQEMLPVNVINYTPPMGVVFIVDTSGSMQQWNDQGMSYFDLAKACSLSALDSLSERDFVGIVTLADESTTVLPMTPRTQETTIRSAIDSLEATGGGTVYATAIQKAAALLLTSEGLAKYHIIMITDGTSSETSYPSIIKENYETHGITLSIVGIGMNQNDSDYIVLEEAVAIGHGRLYIETHIDYLVDALREELSVPMIGDINHGPFPIVINPEYLSLFNVEAESLPTLDGFYGAKLKEGATAILTGVFGVPIYAQWKYGNGLVGSFMCDLNGVFSEQLLNDANGQALIRALILNNFSMPNFTIKNTNNLQNQSENFFFPSQLSDGEKLEIILTDSDNLIIQKLVITNEEDLKNNLSLSVSKTGKYTLSIVKKDQNGTILSEKSYSVTL